MDDMGFVQDINEQHRIDALNDHQRGREPDDNPGIDCCDCNEEIPTLRRRAKPGCRRCVSCQETHEILSNWRAL